MILFFKWFNSKVETSTLWFAGYCFVLRIFCDKFFHSISDQTFYTISIIWWTIFSFMISKGILKLYKDRIKHYSICQGDFNAVYFVCAPISIVYFLMFHPMLGNFFWIAIFFITGLIYMVCDIHKKKKQV